MPYTPTGPFVNGSSPGISAAFLNNVENALVNAISDPAITNDGNGNMTFTTGNIKRAAGQQEKGFYFIQGGGNASGWVVGSWVGTISRTVTPVSVTIDTSLVAPTASAGTPSTSQLTSAGFFVGFGCTAVTNTARCAGAWTVQY